MTLRNRCLAALVVVVLMLSVLSTAFIASAEDELDTCTVVVSIFGSGRVSDGSTVTSDTLVLTPTPGDQITLTATPAEGFEVLYWVNNGTGMQRVLSFENTYSFTAGTSLYILLYFDTEQTILANQYNQHRVVYFTEGNNIVYSGSVQIGSTAYFAMVPNTSLGGGGRTWTGWDTTTLQVSNNPGRVFVYPTYSKDVESYMVTSYVNGIASDEEWRFGTTCALEAPATEDGKPFSYWVQVPDENDPNGEEIIASPNRTYRFVVVMDITLRAVYGADTVPPYAIRVVGDVPDYTNNLITFYVERNALPGYSILGNGMLFTREPVGSADEFTLDDVDGNVIKQGMSTSTARNGTYYFVEEKWIEGGTAGGTYHYPLLYVRGYMVVSDPSGARRTIYTDVYCANHSDREYSFEDNNYDDPLANP